MRRTVCPLHVPLGDYCAEVILERHAETLPDLTNLAILTPNATSGRALRSELMHRAEQRGHQGLLLPPILPFPLWAHQNSPYSGSENHLSELLDLVEVLHQNKVLRALSQADSWSVAREMMSLFDQLWLNETSLPSDREELTSQLQEAYRIEGKPPDQLGDEARIIHLLWTAWSEDSGDLLSSGKCYREALRRLRLPPETEAIYVCGHDRLTRAEIEALTRMGEEVPVSILTRPQALIPLDTDPLPASSPCPPYAAVLEEAFACEQATVVERARACRADHPEDPLKGRLFTFIAEQAEPHARGIDIQIRRWLNEGHRNIGLVTEDRKLARRVRALLERAGIQIQDYAGWALSTTSAASTIERWLECLDQDFHYLALLDILKSPFVRLTASPDHLNQVGDFEQSLHRNNIHGGLQNYRKIAEEEPEWLDFLDQVEEASRPLLALQDQPTGREYMEALLKSLDSLGCRPGLADDEVGEKVLSELDRMYFQLEQNETRLPKSQWRALLRRALEQHNYRRKSSQSAVSLINLGQAHLTRFDCLIVAGMDSRHYPGTDSSFLVFNDSVRSDLGLPTCAELRKLGLQRFLSLILSSGQVLLTYQKTDQDEPLLPSSWWTQVAVFHRLVYGTSLKELSLPVLSLHPDAWVRPPGLQTREPALDVMPNPSVRRELLPNRISASGHQALVDCPYRFYVRYMLRIREADIIREEMDNLEFGGYVHRCLEAFHTGISGAPGPWPGRIAENEASALSLLREIGEHLMEQLAPSPSNIVFLERWKTIARRYVQRQKSMENHQAPIESEQVMECKIDENLVLDGRIDRVDQDENGDWVVIDYKTGTHKISKDEVQNGEQVQLPSYALMAESIQRAEYWWLSQASQKDIPLTSLSGKDLSDLSRKVHARLHDVFQNLYARGGMPANGNEEACKHCYAQGVCRKDLSEIERV
ncbi:MAG: PD-(D/E)XK nuclease family protein [Gammaproteobacteria bacterium]|nr:PD-(D/E)XK nuclease family protein [Gammaproteobacteria bacterium]